MVGVGVDDKPVAVAKTPDKRRRPSQTRRHAIAVGHTISKDERHECLVSRKHRHFDVRPRRLEPLQLRPYPVTMAKTSMASISQE